jgi:predicted lipoprotein with Yx(FWY)xxD motif
MRQRRIVIALATGALGLLGFLAAGAVAGNATQSGATVALRQTKLGPILVSSTGRTLYLFTRDREGRSACSGACVRFWPPLLGARKPTAGPGVRAALLGTTRRPDGRLQVTYNRHPLYRYARDEQPGQTSGQGSSAFQGRWYAVAARGTAVVRPTTSTVGTTTTETTTTTPTDPYP